MTHFGIVCPSVPGHLNPMMALGQELQQRGHRVTSINFLDAEAAAQAAKIEFQAIAQNEYPLGRTAELQKIDGELSGLDALKFTFKIFKELGLLRLQYIPAVIQSAGIDALLVDQTCFEGGAIADHLKIPFITICNALMANAEPNIPPLVTSWRYQSVWWARWRNQIGHKLFNLFISPSFKTIQTYRKQWNLPLYSQISDMWSTLAQISQQPDVFDFPRQQLPKCFHYTAPFVNPNARKPVNFPWEKLDNRPLIYASMGTLKNQLVEVFGAIAFACADLDAQLVISLGGTLTKDALGELPGSPLVVSFAPQLELLQKASLCITHAGLNTALESLNAGVPIVAIPIGDDQPGIAARLKYVGAGEFIELDNLNPNQLKTLVLHVLTNDFYSQNARRLQQALAKINGVKLASDIIEEAIQK